MGRCPTPRPLRRTLQRALPQTTHLQRASRGELSTNLIIFNLCLCFSRLYEGFTTKNIHKLAFFELVDMRKAKISGKTGFYYPLFLEMHVCAYFLAFRLLTGRKNVDTNFKKEVLWIVPAKSHDPINDSAACAGQTR